MDINNIATAALPGSNRTAQPAARVEQSVGDVNRRPAPGAAQPAQPEQAAQPIEDAVSSIQQFVQTVQRNLNFSLDDSTGKVVVKVTDGESGEVIRQIPSEDALRLAESLEQARGLLFKAEA